MTQSNPTALTMVPNQNAPDSPNPSAITPLSG
jgi:hypothetical protein